MEVFKDLIEQLRTHPFRRMLFTIYSYIEDDGYISTVAKDCGVDDLEFIKFDIGDESKSIAEGDRFVIAKYKAFKRYVEKTCQTVPNLSIFILKDLGLVVAVKPKNFDINTITFKDNDD